MPGPGAHLLYALSGGAALSRLAGARRFGPHHCAVYAANAFLGPDLGSFAEWLASFLPSSSAAAAAVGDLAMGVVHHPFYYPLLLGVPLACLYAWLSRRLIRAGVLDEPSGVALSRGQCFYLITAGSLSHFFLDHLFEENGHSTMYTWILSTGWWVGRAPINPDAVIIVGLLCICLVLGFVYINRVKHEKSSTQKSNQSFFLIVVIAILYCMWCASQIYLRNPPQPAIAGMAEGAFSRCDTTCSMDGRCFLCPVHERASFKLRSNASVEYSPFSLGSANSNTLCALLLRWHEIETTPTITTAMRHPSSISYPADNSQEQKKERIIRERAECNRNGGRERSVRLRGRDSGCPITHSDHLPISPPHGGIFSMGW
uniref:Uncharacterized protein n=1 Tax=Oryza punctata TaxID=4537 RepID=A0A0E0KRL8_ORYPU